MEWNFVCNIQIFHVLLFAVCAYICIMKPVWNPACVGSRWSLWTKVAHCRS